MYVTVTWKKKRKLFIFNTSQLIITISQTSKNFPNNFSESIISNLLINKYDQMYKLNHNQMCRENKYWRLTKVCPGRGVCVCVCVSLKINKFFPVFFINEYSSNNYSVIYNNRAQLERLRQRRVKDKFPVKWSTNNSVELGPIELLNCHSIYLQGPFFFFHLIEVQSSIFFPNN